MPTYSNKQSVRVGQETFEIERGDGSLMDYARGLSNLRDMGNRVTRDSYLRHRSVDDTDFLEMYSPKLKAAKKVSTEERPTDRDFPHYIGSATPWIHVRRTPASAGGGGYQEYVMFDFDWQAEKAGFEKGRVFYPVERQKQGKQTVLVQVGEGVPCEVDYRLGS